MNTETKINDAALLPGAVAAVQAAGAAVMQRFSTTARPRDHQQIVERIHANDTASLALMRPALTALRPQAGWVDDEGGEGMLPPGEWWIVDPVEGAINHVHGLGDWGVTATLMRDNAAVLTVVHLPLTEQTYTAVRGQGAFLDGVRLAVSAKTGLHAAMVGTGQAVPGESGATYRRIGQSASAMMEAGAVLKVSVPATLQLLHVAAGQGDVFWQFSGVRSGLVAGALLVAEAGGSVTDVCGQPWTLDSADFLACAPGLRGAAIEALAPALPRIGIFGAGRVAAILAGKLAEAGHAVTIGVRDPARAREWKGAAVTFADLASTARRCDLLINATPGASSLEMLGALRAELSGKILVDVANATEREPTGMPGKLIYPNDSLAARLQQALPETRVVKTLNTMLFSVMADPHSLKPAPTAFLSGNDKDAKATVTAMLGQLGWPAEWVDDLGGIDSARGTEAMMLLVPSLLRTHGLAPFALTVAR